MKLIPAPHPDYAAPAGAGSFRWMWFYKYVAPTALNCRLNPETGFDAASAVSATYL